MDCARRWRRERAMTEREEVMEMLRQLELHAPTWVKKIRAYIRKLERK